MRPFVKRLTLCFTLKSHSQCCFAGTLLLSIWPKHFSNELFMWFRRYDLTADKQLFDSVKAIACEMGIFLQARNDFLDCFADASELQYKPPVDIKSGICTWLSAMAMELGNEQQKSTMQTHYGKNCKTNWKELVIFSIQMFSLFIRSLRRGKYQKNRTTVCRTEFTRTIRSLRRRHLSSHQTANPSTFIIVRTSSTHHDWNIKSNF